MPYRTKRKKIRIIEEKILKLIVLGSGSNVLASDEGCEEIVIRLPNELDKISWLEAVALI